MDSSQDLKQTATQSTNDNQIESSSLATKDHRYVVSVKLRKQIEDKGFRGQWESVRGIVEENDSTYRYKPT